MEKVSRILYGVFYPILILACCDKQIYACLMTEQVSTSQVTFLTNDEDVQVKLAADLCASNPFLQRVISFEAMKKKEKQIVLSLIFLNSLRHRQLSFL